MNSCLSKLLPSLTKIQVQALGKGPPGSPAPGPRPPGQAAGPGRARRPPAAQDSPPAAAHLCLPTAGAPAPPESSLRAAAAHRPASWDATRLLGAPPLAPRLSPAARAGLTKLSQPRAPERARHAAAPPGVRASRAARARVSAPSGVPPAYSSLPAQPKSCTP